MPSRDENRFLLLYGSQTGQAQAIAEEIAEKSADNGFQADIHCLSTTEKKFSIERERCVVIVTSTTGDGEPPDTALKFVRRLRKKTLPNNYLSHLNYTLLGLGDSNYTNFCNCGKTLHQRLTQLGASTFYTPGWADDAVGLEVVVEPWIDGLWSALRSFLHQSSDPALKTVVSSASTETDIIPRTGFNIKSDKIINNSSLGSGDKPDSDLKSSKDKVLQTGGKGDQSEAVTGSTLNRVASPVLPRVVSPVMSGPVSDTIGSDSNSNNSSTSAIEISDNCSLGSSNMAEKLELSTASVESLPLSESKTDCLDQQDNKRNGTNNAVKSEVMQSCAQDVDSPSSSQEKTVENSTETGPGCTATPVAMEPSLKNSVPPLSESSLTVPQLSPAYLKIEFTPGGNITEDDLPIQNKYPLPSAASQVTMATVSSVKVLTSESALKKTLCVRLESCGFSYQPGDSFSVVCYNDPGEVDTLLQRLHVSDQADIPYYLSIIEETKKKNPAVPKYVPDTGTLRHIFSTCLDIREPPKKALLRVLVEHTSDVLEKRRLQELCSKQGSDDYARFIREPSISLLDILNTFPSCLVPVERIIEHLPRLQPRPYSVCSSPLCNPDTLEFVFNVIEIPESGGRTYPRRGVFTGWLDQSSHCIQKRQVVIDEGGEGVPQIQELSIQDNTSSIPLQVPVFARTNQKFHLPDDTSVPVILIGPGTGVAPFVGFLRHRSALRTTSPETRQGEMWLFYGCRHRDKDYLFKQELEQYVTDGTLSQLQVCFSRESSVAGSPRYVQDNIRKHGQQLVKLLDETDAVIYVCGDARNMAKDVNKAMVDIFTEARGISESEATKIVMQLRLKRRYLEDVWT